MSQQGRIDAVDIVPVIQESLSVGQFSNAYAASNVFNGYQDKLALNTLKRHKDDIALFATFLKKVGMIKDNLMVDCAEWQDITFGLVETFKRWQLEQGYAIASINAHLSTVKVYAKLAVKAGTISAEDYALIKMVSGYRHKEGRNADQKREVTRVGAKKAEAVPISQEQVRH
jgi:site-specific recombinase XerD